MAVDGDLVRTTARSARMAAFGAHAIPLAMLAVVVLIAAGPELLRDRIFPYDSVLIAATGGLFHSLFVDLANFAGNPIGWLWDYYAQYPAMFLRRHPPLFGLVEGLVYLVTGVSVFGAKLTVLLFSLLFSASAYLLMYRLFEHKALAFGGAAILIATPLVAQYYRSVWFDIPALSLALLAMYFYLKHREAQTSSWRNLIPMVLFATLSVYTYPLTVVLLGGVAAHLLLVERHTFYKDRKLLSSAAALLVLLLPLVAYTAYFATDNLSAASGGVVADWSQFAPTTQKLSFSYWSEYMRILADAAPVQLVLAAVAVVVCAWKRELRAIGLALSCFIVTYLVFSFFPVKVPRYALSIIVPLSMLGAHAVYMLIRSVPTLTTHTAKNVSAILLIGLSGLQVLMVSDHPEYYYLSGMNEPAKRLLHSRPKANVLYAGNNDAAFVFYMRKHDHHRQAGVYRAGVQLNETDTLTAFIRDENIDSIVFEAAESLPPDSDKRAFAEVVRRYLQSNEQFTQLGTFTLTYSDPARRGGDLFVFVKSAPL